MMTSGDVSAVMVLLCYTCHKRASGFVHVHNYYVIYLPERFYFNMHHFVYNK